MVPPASPSATDHVPSLSALFRTSAVKLAEAPVGRRTAVGEIVTWTDGGGGGAATTVTSALSVLLGSACDAAATWNVPVVAGAVYAPEASIVPPADPSTTDQTTSVSSVPVTVATNRVA